MPLGSTPAEHALARRKARLATSEPWSKDRVDAVSTIGKAEREQKQTRDNAAARISPPKPRPQGMENRAATRAGLASDENADRARPRATPATTSGRRSLSSPSAGSDPATFAKPIPTGGRDPSTFAKPIAAPETRGQRQQRMALARSIAEGKRN